MEKWKLAVLVVAMIMALVIPIALVPLLFGEPVKSPTMTPALAMRLNDESDGNELITQIAAIDRYGIRWDATRIVVHGPCGDGAWNITLLEFSEGNASHLDILPGYDLTLRVLPKADAYGDQGMYIGPGDIVALETEGGFAEGVWIIQLKYLPTGGVMSQVSKTY